MDDGGSELTVRARRRREEREEVDSGGLSVADLLARHGSAGGAAPSRSAHRLRDEPDDPDDQLENEHLEGRDLDDDHLEDDRAPGADHREQHPPDEQGRTERLFPKGTIEPTGSLLTVLDQIGLPRVTGSAGSNAPEPSRPTAPNGSPAGLFAGHRPAPLFTDPSERPPSTEDDSAPTEVIPETVVPGDPPRRPAATLLSAPVPPSVSPLLSPMAGSSASAPSMPSGPPAIDDGSRYDDRQSTPGRADGYRHDGYHHDDEHEADAVERSGDTSGRGTGTNAVDAGYVPDIHPDDAAGDDGAGDDGAGNDYRIADHDAGDHAQDRRNGARTAGPGLDDDAPRDRDLPALDDRNHRDDVGSDRTSDRVAVDGRGAVEPGTDPHDRRAGRDARDGRAGRGEVDQDGDDAWTRGSVADRTAHIDQTLSRLTAIHAGLTDDVTDRVSGSTRLPVVTAASRRIEGVAGRRGGFTLGRRTKLVALVVAAALVLVAGAGFGTSLWLNGKLRTVDALAPAGPGVVDAAGQAGDQNYLLVLSDPADGQAPPSSVTNRVETVLVAHVPAGADRAVLLSVPAGLTVDRPGCQRYDPSSVSYPGDLLPPTSGVSLGSAYQYGGPKCIVAQVQQLTGLSINHFMSLNMASVRDMVDALGGLSMCVPRPVTDDSLGVVVPGAGRQVLGGDAALSYARAWHVRGETEGAGQLAGQALRQRLLLAALLDRVDSAPLLHLPTLASVVGSLGASSLVDGVTLGSLGSLAGVLRDTDPAKVDFVGVPTAGQPDAQGNQVLDAESATALFQTIRADRALPGEGATAPAPLTADAANTTGLPPDAVTVTVRNGSSRTGVANDAAGTLRGLGFQVAGVGDAPHQADGRTVIKASPDQAAQAAALAQAVPDAKVQTVSGTGILDLVLGDSFDGQVSATPTAGSAGPALLTSAQLACH